MVHEALHDGAIFPTGLKHFGHQAEVFDDDVGLIGRVGPHWVPIRQGTFQKAEQLHHLLGWLSRFRFLWPHCIRHIRDEAVPSFEHGDVVQQSLRCHGLSSLKCFKSSLMGTSRYKSSLYSKPFINSWSGKVLVEFSCSSATTFLGHHWDNVPKCFCFFLVSSDAPQIVHQRTNYLSKLKFHNRKYPIRLVHGFAQGTTLSFKTIPNQTKATGMANTRLCLPKSTKFGQKSEASAIHELQAMIKYDETNTVMIFPISFQKCFSQKIVANDNIPVVHYVIRHYLHSRSISFSRSSSYTSSYPLYFLVFWLICPASYSTSFSTSSSSSSSSPPPPPSFSSLPWSSTPLSWASHHRCLHHLHPFFTQHTCFPHHNQQHQPMEDGPTDP